MTDFAHTVEMSESMDATAWAVWSVLEDVRHLPEVSPSTISVDAPARLAEVGDTFRQTVRVGRRDFTSVWRVEEIAPPHRLVISGSVLPGTHYRMTESVAPDGPDASTMTLRMDYHLPFGPLGRLAARLGAERRASSEARTVLSGVRRLAEAP